ncbi:MAG: TY-Chap domain-containing protein [Nocardioides sp.]
MGDRALEVDDAWRELRRRLADRVAGLRAADSLVLSVQVAGLSDGPGPYVTAGGTPTGGWRLEAASNAYLDTAHQLDEASEGQLLAQGWAPPSYLPGQGGPGSANWWVDLDAGEEERAAWLLVQALREAYAVPHPAFLESSGLDLDGLQGPDSPPAPEPPEPPDRVALVEQLPVVRPRDVEHLRELVVETLTVMTGDEVFVDEEGDVVVPCGEQSLIWVGPDLDRPVVSITAILVDRVSRPQAGLAALNLVSGRLPFVSARMLGSRLTLTHELHAMPFVPEHLAGWVARCQVEIDEVAVEAALLLGGERYLENLDQPRPAPVLDEEVATVAELLAAGPVSPRVVAEVFNHSRSAVVRRLVGVRQGHLLAHTEDVDALLDALRAGLRWIVDEPDRLAGARTHPRRRVALRPTIQTALLDDQPDLFESGPGPTG